MDSTDEFNDSETTLLLQSTDALQTASKYCSLLPAVFLGLILNVLDALSYGVIVFPAMDFIPLSATHCGISMFLVSTIVSQLVFSMQGSGIKGAVGSMMIEVMPFLFTMARIVRSVMSAEERHTAVMATLTVCYTLSTLLTGVVFLVLGYMKLGNTVMFFPRHILIGCIGGIGVFLLLTAFELTSGIKLAWNTDTLQLMFRFTYLKVWMTALLIAVGLKLMQTKIRHPLFVPVFYSCLPLVFYAIALSCGYTINELKDLGWLMKLDGEVVPFYTFYSYFDFASINIPAVLACIPTMVALSLFGVLHVPINIPALTLSTEQEVDLNIELIGHGVSNLLSGMFGSLQNYVVYSNSVLFYKSGGNTRTAGLLLALFTFIVMVFGGSVVPLMPIVVVGS